MTRELAVALTALALAAGALTATLADQREPAREPVLLEATILTVEAPDHAYTRGRTLVELQNGTRRQLADVYGEPGDVFMLQVRP